MTGRRRPTRVEDATASDATPDQSILLVVSDLRISFDTPRGRLCAVDGVSFQLDQGETLGVVGESGSGKSALSRAVMGLDRDQANVQGSVRFAGVELTGLPDKVLRTFWGAEVGIVFQDPMTSLNPTKRIGVQVVEALRHRGVLSRRDAEGKAAELLRSVGIADAPRRVRQYPHELSGGMRQRVTIAAALSCSPRLLIGDEPTTGLDVTLQAQVLELLEQEQLKRHMAMILVTHDLGVVRMRTDRLLVMYAGEVVEAGRTDSIFDSPRMPYTEALLHALPRLEGPLHARLHAIPGQPPDPVHFGDGCRFSPRCPYAQERCLHEKPPLVGTEGQDHRHACWYPVGTPAGIEARRRNEGRGKTAAQTPMAAFARGDEA